MALSQSRFLILDAQTSGLSPHSSELIELGWSFSDAPEAIETRLFRPQDFATISKTVWRMTGLRREDLESAEEGERVWRELVERCRQELPIEAIVIHYSRFELPFLRTLHLKVFGESELPWPVICTYEIARRLYSDLPAKTLRAVSGRLGYVLPETHRAHPNVLATRKVWSHLVERLTSESIDSLDSLQTWVKSPVPRKQKTVRKKSYLVEKANRLELPRKPGIYQMYSGDGTLLYIGKATCLRDRVNSYFRQRRTEREMLNELMTQVAEVKVIETETPLEASLLENDLIKTHEPPYNESLREHSRRLLFASPCLTRFSQLTDEDYPLGPFISSRVFESWELLVLLRQGEVDRIDPVMLHYPAEEMKEALDVYLESIHISRDTDIDLLTLWRAAKKVPVELLEAETAQASIYRKLHRPLQTLRSSKRLLALMESRITFGDRYLVFKDGQIVERGFLNESLPPFERTRSSIAKRQEAMSLVTFDRMRILWTELQLLKKKKVDLPITISFSHNRKFAL